MKDDIVDFNGILRGENRQEYAKINGKVKLSITKKFKETETFAKLGEEVAKISKVKVKEIEESDEEDIEKNILE